MEKKVFKFVLTGGPCGGKSTALSAITQMFSSRGYTVLVVAESATELILSGVHPWTPERKHIMAFEYAITAKQILKEDLYEDIIQEIPSDKILVIYDRGIIDAAAFIPDDAFDEILSDFSLTRTQVFARYDAVFHLVTAANGAAQFYTLENNAARSETPEQAIDLDNKTIRAWTGHQHLRIIDNSTDFAGKINRLIAEVCSALGEPIPIEDEKKYLIQYPDLELISKQVNLTCLDIVQTYLCSENPDVERRIRQRGIGNDFTYYYTEKRNFSEGKRIEVEHKISEKEYLSLLLQADITLHQIIKKRYCFVYENQYFELDIYPFSNTQAILEIELTSSTREVVMPSFINVVKDDTNDVSYKNYSLAKSCGFPQV